MDEKQNLAEVVDSQFAVGLQDFYTESKTAGP